MSCQFLCTRLYKSLVTLSKSSQLTSKSKIRVIGLTLNFHLFHLFHLFPCINPQWEMQSQKAWYRIVTTVVSDKSIYFHSYGHFVAEKTYLTNLYKKLILYWSVVLLLFWKELMAFEMIFWCLNLNNTDGHTE